MSKHTTIEQSKASMTVWRVTWEEFEGDAPVFHDFANEAEALAFYTRLLLTGAIAAMEAL